MGLRSVRNHTDSLVQKRIFFLFQSVLAKFIDEVEKLKSKKNVRSCHNKNQATKNVLENVNNQKRKRASVSCTSFLESHDGKSVIPNTGDDVKNLTERMVNWIGKQEKFKQHLWQHASKAKMLKILLQLQ